MAPPLKGEGNSGDDVTIGLAIARGAEWNATAATPESEPEFGNARDALVREYETRVK